MPVATRFLEQIQDYGMWEAEFMHKPTVGLTEAAVMDKAVLGVTMVRPWCMCV